MAFATGIHSMHIGAFACLIIGDVVYPRDPAQPAALAFVDDPAPLNFANATAREMSTALGVLAATSIPTDMSNNILLVDTGQQRILVDTGNGSTETAPGHLVERLATVGVAGTTSTWSS